MYMCIEITQQRISVFSVSKRENTIFHLQELQSTLTLPVTVMTVAYIYIEHIRVDVHKINSTRVLLT